MILVRKLNYENRLVMPDNQTGMNPSNKILFLIIAVLLIFFSCYLNCLCVSF